jgi:hypothetical protein
VTGKGLPLGHLLSVNQGYVVAHASVSVAGVSVVV